MGCLQSLDITAACPACPCPTPKQVYHSVVQFAAVKLVMEKWIGLARFDLEVAEVQLENAIRWQKCLHMCYTDWAATQVQ